MSNLQIDIEYICLHNLWPYPLSKLSITCMEPKNLLFNSHRYINHIFINNVTLHDNVFEHYLYQLVEFILKRIDINELITNLFITCTKTEIEWIYEIFALFDSKSPRIITTIVYKSRLYSNFVFVFLFCSYRLRYIMKHCVLIVLTLLWGNYIQWSRVHWEDFLILH